MVSKPDPWFCKVRLDVAGEVRTCLIGPLPSWSDARDLAASWEREFGAGTVSVRCGASPARFLFVEGRRLCIVPGAVPTVDGGYVARMIRPGSPLSAPGSSR